MSARRLRVYADTSVFGGCFDEEFASASRTFFDEVKAGRFTLVVSTATLRELNQAPVHVQNVLAALPPECVEVLADAQEIIDLREAYLNAGVVTAGSRADAEHVAAASVAGADLIVSWNFKHIVHFNRIKGYHGVNLLGGYGLIGIHSPQAVVGP
jgi:hypothetical protein